MSPRKYDFPVPLLRPDFDPRNCKFVPSPGEGVTDPHNVQALFVVGRRGRRTEHLTRRTVSCYAHYWRVFVRWCESRNVSPLPAAHDTVLEFLKTRFNPEPPEAPVRKQTAYAMLAAIKHAQRQVTLDRIRFDGATAYLRSVEDPPIDLPVVNGIELDRFLASLPEGPASLRTRCLLILIYEELLCMPELAALTVERYVPRENESPAGLCYPRRITGSLEWHPIADRSAAAIKAWIDAARIKTGSIFRRVTATGEGGRPMTDGGIAQTIRTAQSEWGGPRINVRSLHRGRTMDAAHPEAGNEQRSEQRWRIRGGYQFRQQDEPSPMESLMKEYRRRQGAE